METVTEHTEQSKSILEVLEFCKALNLPARVVGKWIWVEFESKPPAETRQALKDFGFRWSARRRKWAHNCGTPSRAGKGNPWQKYSVQPVGQVA